MKENNLVEKGVSDLSKASFINDGVRLQNKATDSIKSSKSAKKEIKSFAKTLPT